MNTRPFRTKTKNSPRRPFAGVVCLLCVYGSAVSQVHDLRTFGHALNGLDVLLHAGLRVLGFAGSHDLAVASFQPESEFAGFVLVQLELSCRWIAPVLR